MLFVLKRSMRIPLFSTIGLAEVITLMRNLAMTLKAGVPVAKALSLFEQDATGQRRAVIRHLKETVEGGRTFAAGMESSPRAFPSIAIHLVKVGELSGTLVENIEALVRHLRRTLDLRRKIRSAMMYPTFVFVACAGLGLSVGTLVLPQLLPLFESLDMELPLSTRILIVFARFFQAYGVNFSVGVIAILIGLFALTRLEKVKPFLHHLYLWIPFIRMVQREAAIAQFASTLATLLKSGIVVREAIPAAGEAVENRIFRRAILAALPAVEGGRTLSEGLQISGKLFPDMTLSLIAIGEETGELASTLEYLAEYYQSEVDYAIKDLTTALEPALLIGIGLLVGFTVMSIITPLYEVTGSIQ